MVALGAGLGGGVEGSEDFTLNGYGVSLGGDRKVLKLIMMVAQLCEYTKDHWIVHLNWIKWMVYEPYLNKAILIKIQEGAIKPLIFIS